MAAAALTLVLASCSDVPDQPAVASVVVTSTPAVAASSAARTAEAASDQAARLAAEQSRSAQASAAAAASSVSAASVVSAQAEASRLAAEQAAAEQAAAEQAAAEQAATEQERQQAAVSAQAEANRAVAQEEARQQAAEAQGQFDAALASGQCTEAPADRVTECVGLAEDSAPAGAQGAGGASANDGSGGWYDSHGNWVSPGTAARAQAKGIQVGGDVPGYLRCGTLCGESPTSGEIQSEWAQQQGLVDSDGVPTDAGG